MSSDVPKDAANASVKNSPNAASGMNSLTPRPKAASLPFDEKKAIVEGEVDEKSERLLLYRRDDVRRLMEWMLRGHDEIRPQRSSETGQYVYSGADFGLEDISARLAELESHKILQRITIDTVPSCPACQHANFHVTYVCPYSQHTMLEHGTIIEHYACGNADFENNYKSGPNEFVCPKCRRTLKVIGTDYRKIERAYRCNGCGRFFGTPKLLLQCRDCDRKNNEEELVMDPIYAYKINEKLRSELISHCSLEANVIAVFEKSGFKVSAPTQLPGLSGVPHNFDIGAKKDDKLIVLDMVSAIDEVGPRDVVEFFAKIYDTKPSEALLIAMPKLSREAQRLGAMYGVNAIGARSPDEVTKRLGALIGTQSTTKTAAPSVPDMGQTLLGLQPETKIDQPLAQPKRESRQEPSEELRIKEATLVEPRAASFIEQAVSLLEKKTDQKTPSEESNTADSLLRQARLRMGQMSQSKPSEDSQSSEEDDILRQAREKMKHLMKEADQVVDQNTTLMPTNSE